MSTKTTLSDELMLVHEGWMDLARCKDEPKEAYFPVRSVGTNQLPQETATAIKLCWEECLVREDCEDFARRTKTTDGLWGGKLLGLPKRRRVPVMEEV